LGSTGRKVAIIGQVGIDATIDKSVVLDQKQVAKSDNREMIQLFRAAGARRHTA
jgi:hypothetical protein